jgi:hypothetical protein
VRSILSLSAGFVVLLAISWLALNLRTARNLAAFGPGLAQESSPAAESRWWIDDGASAYHLRRIELSLATGQLPSEDRFLGTEAGTPIPLRPFPDAALSALASVSLGGLSVTPDGDLAGPLLTDDYEARLEHLLAGVPPWLGVLTTLLVALGAALLARDHGAKQIGQVRSSAVLGALVFGTAPLSVWYGSAGRIGHMPIVIALLGLHTVLVLFLLRERPSALPSNSSRGADSLWAALGAGVVAGLALLSWAPSLVFVGITGAAFLVVLATTSDAMERRIQRTGLLYFAAIAAVTLFPAIGSEWNRAAPFSLLHLTSSLPMVMASMAAVFGAAMALGGQGAEDSKGARATRLRYSLGCLVVAAVALLWLVPDPGGWLFGSDFLVLPEERQTLIAAGGGSLITGLLRDIGWAGLLAPLLVLGLLWSLVSGSKDRSAAGLREFGPALFLVANLMLAGALCLQERQFGVVLALFLGMGIGAGLPQVWQGLSRRSAFAVTVLAVTACLLQARSQWSYLGMDELRDQRSDLVLTLRSLRVGNGAWRSSELRPRGRLLASGNLGPLGTYHGRRPLAGPLAKDLLLETDPAEFLRGIAAQDIDYVAVTAHQAMGLDALQQGVIPSEDSMAWRLGAFTKGAPIQGFELAYRTLGEQHLPGGQSVGPTLSIWRRVEQ